MTDSENLAAFSRQQLIDTIEDTLAMGSERGLVSVVESKLGRVAVMRGRAAPGTLHSQSPVSVTIVDKIQEDGPLEATVLIRGGLMGRTDVQLDPSPEDLTVLAGDRYSFAHDFRLTQLIEGVDYNQLDSLAAAGELLRSPGMYGVVPKEA